MPPRKKAATKSETEVEPVKTATNRKRKDKDLEDENIDAANKKSKIENVELLDTTHESHAESKELTDSENKELKNSISDEIKKETVKIEDDEEDEDDYEAYRLRQKTNEKMKCPYLDTINRQVLDFDMEKLCSVTLVNRNIYACLVCGKFFLGRGKGTPAYTHALQNSHFVFMNIISDVEENFGKAFCLPESYEILDSSLDDIKKCLKPSFTPQEINKLNSNSILARDMHGISYLPGFVGLNNLKCTDYINVVLHALSHVTPIRDYFLNPVNYNFVSKEKFPLVHKFGEVIRKIWSKDNFKSVVSPHDFVQEITTSSHRKFHIGQQAEAVDVLVWLLNELHFGLGGTRKPNSSIIHRTFQGNLKLTKLSKAKKVVAKPNPNPTSTDEFEDEPDQQRQSSGKNEENSQPSWIESTIASPYLILNLEIPATPLFKDSQGGHVIPQIPLFEILRKYDGSTWSDHVGANGLERKRYELESLPNYLIFHLGRFTRNNFDLEKNHTIVTFPIKNLDMKEYLSNANIDSSILSKYDLIANICHDSNVVVGENLNSSTSSSNVLSNGTYRIHNQNKATGQWFELQDLHVTETMPQLIALSEAYILIYEKKTAETHTQLKSANNSNAMEI